MFFAARPPALSLRAAFALLAFAALMTAGCAGNGKLRGAPLVVGISPTAPPMLFEVADEIRGVEADLAARVAERLGRPVRYRRLPFTELFSALEAGEVDWIMGALSITPERAERVLFTDPFIQVGQLSIIRSKDAGRFGRRNAIRQRGARIGYERGSTGEIYVADRLPRARAFAFEDVRAGIRSLRAGRIDFFVHDAPTVWRLAGDPAARDLLGLYRPLTEESLAWAVRDGNEELQAELNASLAALRRTGELETVLSEWIPVRILRR